MRTLIFLCATLILSTSISTAQFGNIGSRLVNKAVNKATDKVVDKATDKAVDRLFDGKDKPKSEGEEAADKSTASSTIAELTAVKEVDWSEFDAVVLPSSKAPRVALLPETDRIFRMLPELPSLEELLQRDEKKFTLYHTSIDKADEELGDYASTVEEKYESLKEQIEKRQLMQYSGLTEAELTRLNDPTISEAERSAIQTKLYANVLASSQSQSGFEPNEQPSVMSVGEIGQAIMQREQIFGRLALTEQRNCEAELVPLNAKLDLARSESRINELGDQIAARRAVTARQLSERNLKEIEWQIVAKRVELNEASAANEHHLQQYTDESDRHALVEYYGIVAQIDYLRSLIYIMRTVDNYLD